MAALAQLRQVFIRESRYAVGEFFLPIRALPAIWSLWTELISHRQLIHSIVEEVTNRSSSRTFATDLVRVEKQIHMHVAIMYGDIDSRFEKADLLLKQWAGTKRPKPNSPSVFIYLLQYCAEAVRFYESLYLRGKGVRARLARKSISSGSLASDKSYESSRLRSERSRKYLEGTAQEAHVLALAEYDRIVEVEEIDVSRRAKELGARHAAEVGLDEEWKRLFD